MVAMSNECGDDVDRLSGRLLANKVSVRRTTTHMLMRKMIASRKRFANFANRFHFANIVTLASSESFVSIWTDWTWTANNCSNR